MTSGEWNSSNKDDKLTRNNQLCASASHQIIIQISNWGSFTNLLWSQQQKRFFEAFAKNLIKNRQEDQWDQQEEFLLVALFCGYFLSSRLPLSSDPTPADRKIIWGKIIFIRPQTRVRCHNEDSFYHHQLMILTMHQRNSLSTTRMMTSFVLILAVIFHLIVPVIFSSGHNVWSLISLATHPSLALLIAFDF